MDLLNHFPAIRGIFGLLIGLCDLVAYIAKLMHLDQTDPLASF